MPKLTPESYRLERAIGYQLAYIRRAYERHLDYRLKPLGLSRQEFKVLVAIGREGCSAPSLVADLLEIEKTAVSRILRGLEAAGLTTSQGLAEDRRVRLIALTPSGEERLEQAIEVAVAIHNRMLKALDPMEMECVEHVLQKLRESL